MDGRPQLSYHGDAKNGSLQNEGLEIDGPVVKPCM